MEIETEPATIHTVRAHSKEKALWDVISRHAEEKDFDLAVVAGSEEIAGRMVHVIELTKQK